MKSLIAILFAAVVLTNGDVSHLKNKYLPPTQHGAASNTYENYESAPSNFNSDYQSDNSETAGFSGLEDAATFTSSQYAAPDNNLNGFSSESSYSAPESAASSDSFQTAEYQDDDSNPFHSSFFVPEGAASVTHFKTVLPAPGVNAFQSSFSAAEGAASIDAPQTTSLESDSNDFASESAASQPAPSLSNSFDASYSAPSASASEVNTQYAADGGYIY